MAPLPETGDLTRRGDLGDVALLLVGLRMGDNGLLPTTPNLGDCARCVLLGETALLGGVLARVGDLKGDFCERTLPPREGGGTGDLDRGRVR